MGMVEIQGLNQINEVNKSKGLNYNDFRPVREEEASIFASVPQQTSVNNPELEYLNDRLDSIMDEQGIFSKGWNGFKEALNVGTSREKCEQYIEKYKNGEMSFEEAVAEIEKFDSKQDSSLNLFSNIATSFAAVAAGTAAAAAVIASGGALAPVVAAALAGAGAGAVTKAGFKLADRATNEIKNDALDAKQIAKDGLSGAVTGAIAGATMGNGTTAGTLKASVVKSAGKAAKTGVITGSVSGSSNYLIDCAFEEDKKFNTGEFLATTAESAVVGGVVGGIMGTANGAMRSFGVIKHGGMVQGSNANVQNASTQDVVANSLCSAEYKVVNDRVRALVS